MSTHNHSNQPNPVRGSISHETMAGGDARAEPLEGAEPTRRLWSGRTAAKATETRDRPQERINAVPEELPDEEAHQAEIPRALEARHQVERDQVEQALFRTMNERFRAEQVRAAIRSAHEAHQAVHERVQVDQARFRTELAQRDEAIRRAQEAQQAAQEQNRRVAEASATTEAAARAAATQRWVLQQGHQSARQADRAAAAARVRAAAQQPQLLQPTEVVHETEEQEHERMILEERERMNREHQKTHTERARAFEAQQAIDRRDQQAQEQAQPQALQPQLLQPAEVARDAVVLEPQEQEDERMLREQRVRAARARAIAVQRAVMADRREHIAAAEAARARAAAEYEAHQARQQRAHEEHQRLLQENHRRLLELQRLHAERARAIQQAMVDGRGNAHPQPLPAASESPEVRVARLRAEREDNNAPDTVALRYSRGCSVCYADNPRRRAVLVACGHMVCTPCAEEMAAGAPAVLTCPICRKRTTYVRVFEDLETETPQSCQETSPEARKREIHSDDSQPTCSKRARN